MLIHDNPMQKTDFILWVVPKNLSCKSSIHSIIHFLVWWFISSFGIIFFFFFAKISSFIKSSINFQLPGCIFVSCVLCESLYTIFGSWHTVTSSLIDVTKFYGTWEFNSAPSNHWWICKLWYLFSVQYTVWLYLLLVHAPRELYHRIFDQVCVLSCHQPLFWEQHIYSLLYGPLRGLRFT